MRNLDTMDKIIIEGLEINTVIGVYDWEREKPQKLIFDLVLTTDLTKAMQSDRVEDTVDYAKVAETIEVLTRQHQPELLEKFADTLLKQLFDKFNVEAIQLKMTKPDILPQTRSVGIELFREKASYQ